MNNATPGHPFRLLQVVHVYHPVVCGSERLFRRIGEGLAARGCAVRVLTSTARAADDLMQARAGRLTPGREMRHGVEICRLQSRRFSSVTYGTLSAATALWTSRRWPGYGRLKAMKVGPHLPGLVREAIAFDADVVTAIAAPCLTLFQAADAARQAGRPFVAMPCLHPDHEWFMDNPSLIDLLCNADAVLTLTPYEGDILRALGVEAARLHLIGGGADDAPPSSRLPDVRTAHSVRGGDQIVLFLGRQEEAKGIGTLLTAMTTLWQRNRAATLVVAGTPTDYSRTNIGAAVAALPAAARDRLIVRDEISEEEKWAWYSAADVFAHPSRDESFGLVYLEAWRAGTPVIAGRTGPQSYVVHDHDDGLLVRPGDAVELADALDRLLFTPGLAERLGAVGRARVDAQHSWTHVVDRVEAVCRAVAGQRPRGAH
jgi:glycogen synthase